MPPEAVAGLSCGVVLATAFGGESAFVTGRFDISLGVGTGRGGADATTGFFGAGFSRSTWVATESDLLTTGLLLAGGGESGAGLRATSVDAAAAGTSGKGASRVVLKVVDTTRKAELQGQVRQYVLKGAEVHTDALKSYEGLADEYTHNVIDHAVEYVRGNVHTNGLENFWSLLKRTIKGTYVSVEPFHLFRYLDEQAFRFNERKDNDQGRFLKAFAGIFGKRLCYKALIGQDGTALLR